jgi:hypothetical protein
VYLIDLRFLPWPRQELCGKSNLYEWEIDLVSCGYSLKSVPALEWYPRHDVLRLFWLFGGSRITRVLRWFCEQCLSHSRRLLPARRRAMRDGFLADLYCTAIYCNPQYFRRIWLQKVSILVLHILPCGDLVHTSLLPDENISCASAPVYEQSKHPILHRLSVLWVISWSPDVEEITAGGRIRVFQHTNISRKRCRQLSPSRDVEFIWVGPYSE